MPTREDILFGAAALRRHWLDQRDLHKAIRLVEAEEKDGKRRALGDVLIERGFLTPSQEGELLAQLKVKPFRCPACESEHYGPDEAEAAPCALCGEAMAPRAPTPHDRDPDMPETDADLAAADLLQDDLDRDDDLAPAAADPADALAPADATPPDELPPTEVDAGPVRLHVHPPSGADRGFVYPLAESPAASGWLVWWFIAAVVVSLAVGFGLGYWAGAMGG